MQTAPSNQDQCLIAVPYLKIAKRIARIGGYAIIRHKNRSRIELFKEVNKKLQMRKIAKPLALNMRKLRPSLAKVFDDRLTLKTPLIMSIISFIGSMVLHALFMWIYHKCEKEKTDLMQLLAPLLTQESNTDSNFRKH